MHYFWFPYELDITIEKKLCKIKATYHRAKFRLSYDFKTYTKQINLYTIYKSLKITLVFPFPFPITPVTIIFIQRLAKMYQLSGISFIFRYVVLVATKIH